MAAVFRGHGSREVEESTRRPGEATRPVHSGSRLPATRLSAASFCIDSVPHPFALFLAKGWETSKAKRANSCGQRQSRVPPVSILRPGIAHPQSASKAKRTNSRSQRHGRWLRAFGRIILYRFRAPSFRLFSGERVGNHKSQRTNLCGQRQSRVPPVSILRPGITSHFTLTLNPLASTNRDKLPGRAVWGCSWHIARCPGHSVGRFCSESSANRP